MTQITKTIGYYRQADLEAMGTEELRAVMKMAQAEFNRGLGKREYTQGEIESEEYFEVLAGAAGEILAGRGEAF